MPLSSTSAEAAILGLAKLNPISAAIANLYSAGQGLNQFINEHIDELKKSDNPVIASTGRVLEAAKFGFGLGYLSSVAIIAVGQLILGNNLAVGVVSAAATVGSAALLVNPVAMTCGAVGAICYGWGALTTQEQDAILHRIREGLEVGTELIRSLIDFVIRKAKNFLDSEHLVELKKFIGEQAQRFDRTIADITRATGDKFVQAVGNAKQASQDLVDVLAKAKNTVTTQLSKSNNEVVEPSAPAKWAFAKSKTDQAIERR